MKLLNTVSMSFEWMLKELFQFRSFSFTTEHSENEDTTQSGLFENEIGPELSPPSVREIRTLQECQRDKEYTTDYVSILSQLSGFCAEQRLFYAGLEHTRSKTHFRNW